MRTLRLSSILGLVVILSAAAPAWAGRKSFSIDPWSTTLQGAVHNIESGNDGGLELLGSGSSTFGFGFQIPKNYRTNSPVSVTFRWHAFSQSCDLFIAPVALTVARTGLVTPNLNVTDGVMAADGTDLWTTTATSDFGLTKIYTLAPGPTFDLKAGDDILLGFSRDAADLSDTCVSEMFITGITITYITR